MPLGASRRAMIVRYMMNWTARILFPRLVKVRRGREVRFLLVAILLGLPACAAIAGIIYYFGTCP